MQKMNLAKTYTWDGLAIDLNVPADKVQDFVRNPALYFGIGSSLVEKCQYIVTLMEQGTLDKAAAETFLDRQEFYKRYYDAKRTLQENIQRMSRLMYATGYYDGDKEGACARLCGWTLTQVVSSLTEMAAKEKPEYERKKAQIVGPASIFQHMQYDLLMHCLGLLEDYGSSKRLTEIARKRDIGVTNFLGGILQIIESVTNHAITTDVVGWKTMQRREKEKKEHSDDA